MLQSVTELSTVSVRVMGGTLKHKKRNYHERESENSMHKHGVEI